MYKENKRRTLGTVLCRMITLEIKIIIWKSDLWILIHIRIRIKNVRCRIRSRYYAGSYGITIFRWFGVWLDWIVAAYLALVVYGFLVLGGGTSTYTVLT